MEEILKQKREKMQFTTPKQIIQHRMKCPDNSNEEGKREFVEEILDVMASSEIDWIISKLVSNFNSQAQKFPEPFFEYQRYCQGAIGK